MNQERVKRMFMWLVVFIVLGGWRAAAEAPLAIGDPAPAWKVAKWIKGQPIARLETGQVYVVEFWATWCGPCRMTAPHLTKIAQDFTGKAHVIGVDTFEREPDDAKRFATVSQFVEKMGEKMNYHVGADDREQTMAKNWMLAADRTGIPTAFIVGRDGKIAWIGHPLMEMDKVLTQVIAGTFDSKAEAARQAKAQGAQTMERKLMQTINNLQNQGKFREAMIELDRAVADRPELAKTTRVLRFELLLECDEPAAYIQARALAEGDLKDDANGLYRLARSITDPNPKRKAPDYEGAVVIATRACDLTKFEDPYQLAVLAEAQFGLGDVTKAIGIEQLALSLLTQKPGAPEGSVIYLSDRLEYFKKATQTK